MKKQLIFGTIFAVCASGTGNAATTVYSDEASFLTAVGGSYDNFVDFESGFVDGQNLSNALVTPTLQTVRYGGLPSFFLVESGAGSISGSNPIGNFALELPSSNGNIIQFNFNNNFLDYFGFYYIDAGTPQAAIGNGTGEIIDLPSTGASGDTARFAGFVFDVPARYVIVRSVQGDATWGVDNLSFGNISQSATVPVPAALPLLATALGGLGFAAHRRRRAEERA